MVGPTEVMIATMLVRMVWMSDISSTGHLPVVSLIVSLLVAMVDEDPTMLIDIVVIVVFDVLTAVTADQVLVQVDVVLAEEVRVDEGVVDRRDLNVIGLLTFTVRGNMMGLSMG